MKAAVICVSVSAMLTLSLPARAGFELSGVVLTTDRTVDATSNESIAKGVWRPGMNEQQKAYAMWRFFISRAMHKEEAPMEDEGNAAELLTKTGYAICGNFSGMYANTMADNGMTAARVGLNGHWIDAVQYWGDWHAFDTDMDDLYVKADGIVANPQDIRRLKGPDGKFVLRDGAPIKSFPWYLGPDSIQGTASLYNRVSIETPSPAAHPRKWVYNLKLRPGEEIVWSWYGDPDVGFVSLSHLPDVRSKHPAKTLREYLEGTYDYYTQKEGKPVWNWGYRRGGLTPNPLQSWNGVDGNGRVIMDLGADGFKNALAMASAVQNLAVSDSKLGLVDAAKPGTLDVNFQIPYDYGDAWIAKPLPESGLKIELACAGKAFEQVYPGGAGVDDGKRIRLFDLVRGRSEFVLRFTLEPGAAPLESLKAIGAFHLAYTVLPAVLKGKNQVSVRLDQPKLLAAAPLHVTYVYDQVDDDKKIMRVEKVLNFTRDSLSQPLDTGEKHWPLMREIHMRCGGEAAVEAPATPETGELDWAAAPWPWVYYGVNFWNDFERGDRQGWAGRLTTSNTFDRSDFALADSLLSADGQRELKIIRFGSFLNRDTHFRCQIFVKNAARLRISTRNQGETKDNYYEKTFTDLKDGQWQPFEVSLNDLAKFADPAKYIQNNMFLSNIYLQVWPAEGRTVNDVEFSIDNTCCWDGTLKDDPCVDPEAPQKSLADDPIWNAKKPTDAVQ